MPCFLLDERDWKAALYCRLFFPRYTLDTLGLRDVLYHFLGCCHLWWCLLWSVITPKPSSSSSFPLLSEHRNPFFFLKSFYRFFSVSHKNKRFPQISSTFTTYDVYQPCGHIRDIILLFWWLKTLWGHLPKSWLGATTEKWTFTVSLSKAVRQKGELCSDFNCGPNHWVQMKIR